MKRPTAFTWRPWRRINELHDEIRRIRDEMRELRDDLQFTGQQLYDAQNTIDALLEPPQVDGCNKVRLRDQAEAQAFLERVENDNGTCNVLKTYRCPVCPRHPVHGTRFWHVAHQKKTQRGRNGQQYKQTRRREGPQIRDRFTPADLAKLKERLGNQGGT